MGGIKKTTRWNRVCPVCGDPIDPNSYRILEVKGKEKKVCLGCF